MLILDACSVKFYNIHMSLHLLVEDALRYAPPYQEYLEDSANFYTDKEDDHPYPFNMGLDPGPNSAYINANETDASIEELFLAYTKVVGKEPNLAFMREAAAHEREHRQAAQMLGSTEGYFGIELYEGGIAIPFHAPKNLQTTKLGRALISAYPSTLSEGDITAYKNLGYTDVFDLKNRAVAKNRANESCDIFYPIPCSSWQTSGSFERSFGWESEEEG